jgi:hypothetical protein
VGAFLTCRQFVKNARQLVLRNRRLPNQGEAEDLVQSIRTLVQSVADKAGVPTREFAATLVGVVATQNEAVAIHVGDGAVIWQQADEWKTASWPAHGEYASTTYFVTDDELKVRVSATDVPVDSVALFSDGLERLVLDFAKVQPHAPFFDRMIDPVRKASHAGRNADLSLQLKGFLTQDRVNARTDDDKTLVLVAR